MFLVIQTSRHHIGSRERLLEQMIPKELFKSLPICLTVYLPNGGFINIYWSVHRPLLCDAVDVTKILPS